MRAYEHEVLWEVLTERFAQLDVAYKTFDFEKILALLGVLVREYAQACQGDGALLWRTMLEPVAGDVVVH